MTTGAESDLDQVSNIARQMVGRWGMSEAIGPVTVLPPPGSESPLGLDGVAPATKELIDAEVRKIVDACYAEAVELLREHRDQLDRLAHTLLEVETLDEDDGVRGGRHQPGDGAGCGGPRRETRHHRPHRACRRTARPATSCRSPPRDREL